jgi:L-fuconate dehydratase
VTPTRITEVETIDVRFPTARRDGVSDAMNLDPDYSAAYLVLHTSAPDLAGHGLTFTIGRGNDLVVRAVEQLAAPLVGLRIGDLVREMPRVLRSLTGDSQIRWLGPEKGVTHLATAAVLNALWDLWAKHARVPLWELLLSLTPEELVGALDFRHVQDVITPGEAVDMLTRARAGFGERLAELERDGYPAYITSAGWIGYDDADVRERVRSAQADGWRHFKLKVGGDPDDDLRRARMLRELIGDDARLMLDANQVWEVPQAIEMMRTLAACDPYWIEEPTSPDDILGHATIARAVAPIRVATGEHVHNRIMFKQLFVAQAIRVCQADACRLAGVNENVLVYLMAAKHGIPVCPHAGGVGLCEMVQHLAIFDHLAISGSLEGRMAEYVDHLHEAFADPVEMSGAAYRVPRRPGYSTEMLPEALERHTYPDGAAWQEAAVA